MRAGALRGRTVAAIYVSKDLTLRRSAEVYIANDLTNRGIKGVTSYTCWRITAAMAMRPARPSGPPAWMRPS